VIRVRLAANDRDELRLRGGVPVRGREWLDLDVEDWPEEAIQDLFADALVDARELDERGEVAPTREAWKRELRAKDPLRFTTPGWERVVPQLFERRTSGGWVTWVPDQHLEQKEG
jgi:hypothetical protein